MAVSWQGAISSEPNEPLDPPPPLTVQQQHTHTHTHPFNGPFSMTTRVSRYQKGKPIWILLKQETVSGSGISWAYASLHLAPER